MSFVYSTRSKYFHRDNHGRTVCSGKQTRLSIHVTRPLQEGDPANWHVENQVTGGRLTMCLKGCWEGWEQ